MISSPNVHYVIPVKEQIHTAVGQNRGSINRPHTDICPTDLTKVQKQLTEEDSHFKKWCSRNNWTSIDRKKNASYTKTNSKEIILLNVKHSDTFMGNKEKIFI